MRYVLLLAAILLALVYGLDFRYPWLGIFCLVLAAAIALRVIYEAARSGNISRLKPIIMEVIPEPGERLNTAQVADRLKKTGRVGWLGGLELALFELERGCQLEHYERGHPPKNRNEWTRRVRTSTL